MDTIFKVLVIAIIISLVIGVFGTISFSWTLDTSPYLMGLAEILAIVYYVLPIGKLSPIIVCFVSLMVFRIAVSFIKTIWELIPIHG